MDLVKQRFRIGHYSKGDDNGEIGELRQVNERLHETLDRYKEGIAKHYRNKKWDRFKKHCNDHELVFTSTPESPSIAARCPVSRSYFKLWESMHDFSDLFKLGSTPVKAVFLAEGPGGFVEAFCSRRAGTPGDTLFGMTLLSSNKNVPEWRLGCQELHGKPFSIVTGTDGTGNIYNQSNIQTLVTSVGRATADFITADGGFDFSGNFNMQEQVSTRLIAAEAYTAMSVQKLGGVFFLKVYDIRQAPTLVLLSILGRCYDAVHLTKPLSSRPANSEKYVICTGFKGCDAASLALLKATVVTGDLKALEGERNTLSVAFLRDIIDANTHFIERQITSIDETLRFIQLHDTAASEDAKKTMLAARCADQALKSHAWCIRYNVGVSESATTRYAFN
ncbi:Cap-specific mRNA (nucleoside-2'-O-)-methyltransferase 1 [Tetrabaena socialis]|uniref:Cap-specific mRNA (nucleoside-2'-O-)-methyltransferase 1 n=1 Tax=Tetrabaena socialis TaxID=47790 RepID=A0A2J7ZHV7_9CHLO|nr:Cap-specific mRNA (nucleoside-2'-O-)-methyltransferase 1 [Tetrabaena socialis]|eukprot:PNG99853.1 Cap-specific mRNA (nucleoside-2'-O-)-methyltransferase 1 [Tetrabaena socialis]